MTRYILTAEARSDYFDAHDFIASTSEKAALRWERSMLQTFDRLADYPLTGKLRPEFAPESLRFWVEGDYVILYDPSAAPLIVIAVLHGAQDLIGLIARRYVAYDQPED